MRNPRFQMLLMSFGFRVTYKRCEQFKGKMVPSTSYSTFKDQLLSQNQRFY